MSLERFQRVVKSIDQLTDLVGLPSELALKKQLSELDEHMKSFIAQSPFLLIGTYGRDGTCDVSPRGDPPGSIGVLDSKTFVIPDRRGNRRVDSLRNIVETGRIGLLFLIPGVGETLRVNGRAALIEDEGVLGSLAADGKVPQLGIAVEVEECFLQCAKAVIRSKLWGDGARRRDCTLPSFAEILVDQVRLEGETVDSLRERIENSYKNQLY